MRPSETYSCNGETLMRTAKLVIVLMAVVLVFAGCRTSKVYFMEPEKATLILMGDDEEYLLPKMLELPQRDHPATVDRDTIGGQRVWMLLPDGV